MMAHDPLPDFVDRALLDTDERVAGDTPCVKCEYNLRTLAATSVCPECAHPVTESLRSSRLRDADPGWLSHLAAGAACLAVGAAGPPVLAVLSICVYAVDVSLNSYVDVFAAVGAIGALIAAIPGLAAIVGLVLITWREPEPGRREEMISARRLVRLLLLPLLASLVPALAEPLWATVSGVVMLGPVSGFVLSHCISLAKRVPDARLTRWTNGLAVAHVAYLACIVLFSLISTQLARSSIWPGLLLVTAALFGLALSTLAAWVFGGLSRALDRVRAAQQTEAQDS